MTDQVQLGVSTVMAGEILTRGDGGEVVVPDDLVQLAAYLDGTLHGTYEMTAEQALTLAEALRKAAVKLINAEVTDSGKSTGLLHRMTRLGLLPTTDKDGQ